MGAPSTTRLSRTRRTRRSTTTPVSREKPYLFVDAHGRYSVRVPVGAAPTRAAPPGATAMTAGPHHPARATSSSPSRRDSVADDQHRSSRAARTCCSPRASTTSTSSIEVKRADTVVLGLGPRHAHRRRRRGPARRSPTSPASIVAGRHDRRRHGRVAGAAAGRQASTATTARAARPSNPTTLTDVYFRVGGPHVGKADDRARGQQRQRADRPHLGVARRPRRRGLHRHGDTERWNTNTGRNGVVVNGDNVTATGLFVEHFQQYNTVWNGENGTDDPLPERAAVRPADPGRLDAPTARSGLRRLQGRRRRDDATASYGGGVYVFNRNNPSIHHRERLRGARDRRASSCTTS